ncbi:hypothetical protein HMPREF1861_00604 [Corynebacterium kroppenstedtii]|nr:hypothetical protein HMPREF1861_00604 [Corynebacterium kroppenstedtii]
MNRCSGLAQRCCGNTIHNGYLAGVFVKHNGACTTFTPFSG